MNEEELIRVLQTINAVRAGCGFDPLPEILKGAAPDGENDPGVTCPLARSFPQMVIAADYIRTPCRRTAEALSLSFGEAAQTFVEFPGEFVIDLPELLIDFIAHYDQHELPQFIE
ncbi:MAG: hypothetical protein ABI977_33255 [Acidobacteriota bacterium]